MITRFLLLALLSALNGPVMAQALIDHNKALAGNITPGDTPGYPITITRPGHYKLMGNLSVPAGANGIEITVPNVTLDLNGFTVAGPVECTRDGVTRVVSCNSYTQSFGVRAEMPDAVYGLVLRNGIVRGFGSGVYGLGSAVAVEDLMVLHNYHSGIVIGTGRIERCTAMYNGNNGLFAIRGQVLRSTAAYNNNMGINANAGIQFQVSETTAHSNGNAGIRNATVRGTVQWDNGVDNRSTLRSAGDNADPSGIF